MGKNLNQVQSNWVAYVGAFQFPEGSASSQRVLGVSKVMSLCGLNVVVAAGKESDGQSSFVNKQIEYGNHSISFEVTGDGPYALDTKVEKLKYHLLDGGKQTVQWLDSKETKPKAVVYYGVNSSFISKLKNWCRSFAIPFIIDVVEWYDHKHLGGHLSLLNIENKYALKFLIPKCDGVIAISTLLENHYSKYKKTVVRIPIIDNTPKEFRIGETPLKLPIKLVYAGDSGGGKKDLLNIIIKEVALRPEKFQLDIYGVSQSKLETFDVFQENRKLKEASNIIAHGRVSRKVVFSGLKNAHFIPLLRENKKYAQAGFPTKMVEAMGLGVPLIANLTGDMNHFLLHAETGWVVPSLDGFGDALDDVIKLRPAEYELIRKNAKKKMEELYPEEFLPAMKMFFNKCKVC